MLLSAHGLTVIHSAGSATVPLASFSARGFDADRLPPGHDADYNVLRATTAASGAAVVATTGIAQAGWHDLPADAVIAYGTSVVTVPL